MTIAKRHRPSKRQLGQFITPESLVMRMLGRVELTPKMRILEPSFGDGAFVLPVLQRVIGQLAGGTAKRLEKALSENLYGVELDEKLYRRCLHRIEAEFGPLPPEHNLVCTF